jgi:hypothetical protein
MQLNRSASLAGGRGERLVFVAASFTSVRNLDDDVVFVECLWATSYEGHMVDALASRAEEGRRSLR